MAGTVEPLVSFFSGETGGDTSCDSTTDWAGDVDPVLDTDIFIQGTGSLSAKTGKLVVQHIWFDIAGTVDLTDVVLYSWWFTLQIGIVGLKSEGGIRLRVESSPSDWAEWYLAGRDTWAGGWRCFPVWTGSTPDETSGTVNMAAINRIAVGWYTIKAPKLYPNIFWDAIRYGTGLRIKGGTEASPATFNDILAAEDLVANKWGILEEYEGIIYASGKLYFGSPVDGEATYFSDINEVVIFKDLPFGDFYEIILQGNATATTKIYFGSKSGEAGISGCVFRSAGASTCSIDATDPNITDLGFYGCSFFNMGTISLPPYSTTREVLNCNFEASAMVLPDTCIVKFCKFISADDAAIQIADTDHNVTDSDFIANPYAVRMPTAGTFTFDALIFTGNTIDIDNTSGGAITINATNGSNPTTYTGDTTIINTVYLTVDVEDVDGVPIENAAVRIERLSDGAELMNQYTDVNGRAQTTYNYLGDEAIEIRVRKSSPTATRYEAYTTSGTITSAGFALTVVLREDEIA